MERPPGERRLGKGFALPLAPNPVRRAAALPTPTEEFRRVSEANLEVERFGEKAKWLFRKISRPEHRSSLKSWFGAETEDEQSEPGGRAFEL